jgi:hypothetical protein
MISEYPEILGVSPQYLREFSSFPLGDDIIFVNRAIYDFEKSHDIAVMVKPRWDVDAETPYWIVEVSDSLTGIGATSTVDVLFESVEQAATHIESSLDRLAQSV